MFVKKIKINNDTLINKFKLNCNIGERKSQFDFFSKLLSREICVKTSELTQGCGIISGLLVVADVSMFRSRGGRKMILCVGLCVCTGMCAQIYHMRPELIKSV